MPRQKPCLWAFLNVVTLVTWRAQGECWELCVCGDTVRNSAMKLGVGAPPTPIRCESCFSTWSVPGGKMTTGYGDCYQDSHRSITLAGCGSCLLTVTNAGVVEPKENSEWVLWC